MKRLQFIDFWIPKYKYQLAEWLNNYYKTKKFNRYKKKRLYAIYFNVRKKEVNYAEKKGY